MPEELYDRNAEQTLIGALLMASNDALSDLQGLGPEDFYCPDCKALYACCISLWQRGDAITNVSLFKEFQASDSPIDTTTIATLIGQVGSMTVTARDIAFLAQPIRSFAVRRRAIKTIREILESAHDLSTPLETVLDQARLSLDQLNWLPSASRMVLFRDGSEIGGDHPLYEFNILRPSDMFATQIRLTSPELDKPSEVKRIIRERVHFNPLLPPADKWDDFINTIVSQSRRTQTPEALKEDGQIIYWLREWFKTATPAEEPDDMVNGYAVKDDRYCIQPQRVIKWLDDHAKMKPPIATFWAVLKGHGAKHTVSCRFKRGGSRNLWSIPKEFFASDFDESQLALEDIDLSIYEEPVASSKPESMSEPRSKSIPLPPSDEIDLSLYEEADYNAKSPKRSH